VNGLASFRSRFESSQRKNNKTCLKNTPATKERTEHVDSAHLRLPLNLFVVSVFFVANEQKSRPGCSYRCPSSAFQFITSVTGAVVPPAVILARNI